MSNKIPTFDENIEGIVDAINHFYDIKFKGYRKYDYKGVELDIHEILVCSPNIKDTLKSSNLKYSHQEQGRSPLHEIVGKAFQLGCQQVYKTKIAEVEKRCDLFYLAAMASSAQVKELEAEIERLKKIMP